MYSDPNDQSGTMVNPDEENEYEEDEKYVETETPRYVSITDQVPVVDFKIEPPTTDRSDNSNFMTQPNSNAKSQIKKQKSEGSLSKKNEIFGILDLKPEILNVPSNFNEPATIEAMERLGFVQDDLMPSDYTDVPGNEEMRSKIILELEKRRIQMIEEVINERNKILKGEPEKTTLNVSTIPKNSKKKKKGKGKAANNKSKGKATKGKGKGKKRKKKRKKKNGDDESEINLEVSAPKNFRKRRVVRKEVPADVIRRKKIEETIQVQQMKIASEIAKKQKESEKRVKLTQDYKNKKLDEIKRKRLQKKKEIEDKKKAQDDQKKKSLQKALRKLDAVEQRQAEIKKQKLLEIQKRNKLREERRKQAEAELKKKEDEKLKKIQLTVKRTERLSKLALEAKAKGNRTAKIVVPQVSPKKK